ncbi:hypothetical protein CD191_25465 [Paenibacillus odorifer]|uniref:Uncharacterized protein n=1 Tax=Paenibacillus odorifer TaxID=189426 RepID=A0AAD0P645_9BACL|nr:hypothetical protein CD191_25465 [Paenibacillus odorifer]
MVAGGSRVVAGGSRVVAGGSRVVAGGSRVVRGGSRVLAGGSVCFRTQLQLFAGLGPFLDSFGLERRYSS